MDHIHTETKKWIDNVEKLGDKSAPMSVAFMKEVLQNLPQPVESEVKDTKGSMIRFSGEQTKMLFWAYDAEVSMGLTSRNYLYVETGPCKPWHQGTHRSLVKRGLMTADERCSGVFYVYLTEKGREAAKDIHTNLNVRDLVSLSSYSLQT